MAKKSNPVKTTLTHVPRLIEFPNLHSVCFAYTLATEGKTRIAAEAAEQSKHVEYSTRITVLTDSSNTDVGYHNYPSIEQFENREVPDPDQDNATVEDNIVNLAAEQLLNAIPNAIIKYYTIEPVNLDSAIVVA